MPAWLQLACSLQPPCPSRHRSATAGRDRVSGRTERGGGLPPAPQLTCARAAIPFVAQAALAAVARAAHGLGGARWGTHGLQLCPPGTPPTHIQVRSCPSGCPWTPPTHHQWLHWSVQLGHTRYTRAYESTRVDTNANSTHSAAPHSLAQSSLPHRSRSQSPRGLRHSGHGRCSGRLGRHQQAHGVGVWAAGLRGQGRTGGSGQPTLALGPKGTRGAEFTRCPCKPRMALALPAATHAIHAHAVATTGAAGTTRAS